MTINKTFSEILAPITEAEFFEEYYDKKPLHIPGDPDKFPNLMDFDILSRILGLNSIWTADTLGLMLDNTQVPREKYCDPGSRDGRNVLIPNAEKVGGFLQAGASVVAIDIDTLTPEISALADTLEDALSAKAQANLYFSSQRRQAFASHFDTHDVYAFHTVGEKVWRIYENREPHPIRHAAFKVPPEQAKARRGGVLMDVTMKPGDLLYIPRGQYHDALASDDFAMHIAMGVTGIIGYDLVSALLERTMHDERFRVNFPRAALGRDALKTRIEALGAAIAEIAASDSFIDQFSQYQQRFRNNRMKLSLPVPVAEEVLRVKTPGLTVKSVQGRPVLASASGAMPIPPGKEKIAAWIVAQDRFTAHQAASALSEFDLLTVNETINDFRKMGLVAGAGAP